MGIWAEVVKSCSYRREKRDSVDNGPPLPVEACQRKLEKQK